MNKKLLCLVLSVTMVVTMLVGCGKKADTTSQTDTAVTEAKTTDAAVTSDPVKLTVWCWDAFNIESAKKAAEIYSKEKPNVTVDVVDTAWNDIQTKLTTAVTSGQLDTLPDILLLQDNALARNIMTYPDAFTDLTNSGIDFSKFAQFKAALSMVDGKNYGVPFDNGAAITCLRTDVLEEAGFTIEDFTDITWDQFIEKGKVVLAKTGKPLLSNLAGQPDLLMMMMQSCGQWVLDKDGKPNFVNNATLKEVVNTYVTLVKEGILVEVNDWNGYVSSINTGTVAGAMNGCWIIGTITGADDQSGKWAVTNLPKLSVEGATNYSSQGGSSWVVSSGSKNPEVAIDFLNKTFAGSTELYDEILPKLGAIATWLPAADSTAYAQSSDYFGGDKIYSKIVDYASKVPQVNYGVYNFEARNSIGAAITKILSGENYDKAIEQAQTDTEFQMQQ